MNSASGVASASEGGVMKKFTVIVVIIQLATAPKRVILKGLSHEIDFKNFDINLQNLA